MNIAILSIHSCPLGRLGSKDTGGMSVYIRELARELGKRGHHVDVFTRSHDPDDNQIVSLGINARLIHLKVGEIREIPKLDVYPYLAEFASAVDDFKKSNNFNYQIIHSHYWLSGWCGRQLQKWWNIPHIIMFHTLGAVKNTIGIGENEPDIRIETEKKLIHECQRIIVATQREKQELIYHYSASPKILSVIPCGVNLQIFKPVDKLIAREKLGFHNEKIILFVGRIEPLKGIDNLISAVSSLPQNINARLVIAGGDYRSQSELERLQILSRQLQVENSIKFVGPVNQKELPVYYSAADICVVPSYHESFGLVTLESLACGTPVVTTKVGGAEEIIIQGGNGYIVENNNPSLLSEKIAILLYRPVIYENTMKIRASVADLSWSAMTDKIVNVYQKTLDDKSSKLVNQGYCCI